MGRAAIGRGASRRSLSALIAGVLLATLSLPAGAVDAHRTEVRAPVHDGVTWEKRRAGSPQLAFDVAHVEPDAPVRLVPVISDGQLAENAPARRLAPTSSMCSAVGGVVCVNADFWVCSTCGTPIGGVVHDGVPLRSPTPLHEQVTLLDDGRLVTDRLELDLRVVAIFEPDERGPLEAIVQQPEGPREEVLDIAAVNRPTPDGVVLYSPRWATTTQTRDETTEAVFSGGVPRIGDRTDVELVRTGGPDSPIPTDGFVLSAGGSARDRLADGLASMAEADRLELRVGADLPARMSTGGHPVLLRDGERLALDQADGKVRNRHPRTLIGWNPDGHRWLVTVDGRRPGHSVGVTLAEATGILEALGATDGLNLDGGGSTTFVTGVPCSDGRSPCVRNVPSDGQQRGVTTALALVPAGGTSLSAAPTPPPPSTTATSPQPPTTTPQPPTTTPPPTTEPPPPQPTTPTVAPPATPAPPPTASIAATTTVVTPPAPAETQPGLAIPAQSRDATPAQTTDPSASPGAPVAIAALGVVLVGSLTTREWRRQRWGHHRR